MLAYVFWHARDTAVEAATYELRLKRFHTALASEPPHGFIRSFSTRTSRLPWLDAETAYEDWYCLADSAALDTLDAAAVDARRRGVHDDVARTARAGAGGLYRLVGGTPLVPSETVWFGKPDGTTYADFAPVLASLIRDGSTLWQRQMVLGPAPEYARQSRSTTLIRGERILHYDLGLNTANEAAKP